MDSLNYKNLNIKYLSIHISFKIYYLDLYKFLKLFINYFIIYPNHSIKFNLYLKNYEISI